MASTDDEVAVNGFKTLLEANTAFIAALGGQKVYRDTIPQGVPNPAVAVAASGFESAIRPLRQGGVSTQIWSRGTVSAYLRTAPGYNGNLARLLVDAVDNKASVVVASLGMVHSIRYTDVHDEPVQVGDVAYKLKKINFDVSAKAT